MSARFEEDDTTVEAIAYDQGVRSIDNQQQALTNLHARTGTLLAATALVASLLGSVTIKAHPRAALTWVAIVVLVAGLTCCLVVLSPGGATPEDTDGRARRLCGRLRRSRPLARLLPPLEPWRFHVQPTVILEHWGTGHPRDLSLKRFMAETSESARIANQRRLNRLYGWFAAAAVLLSVQIVVWTVSLAVYE